jgi:hypothetical protein
MNTKICTFKMKNSTKLLNPTLDVRKMNDTSKQEEQISDLVKKAKKLEQKRKLLKHLACL